MQHRFELMIICWATEAVVVNPTELLQKTAEDDLQRTEESQHWSVNLEGSATSVQKHCSCSGFLLNVSTDIQAHHLLTLLIPHFHEIKVSGSAAGELFHFGIFGLSGLS